MRTDTGQKTLITPKEAIRRAVGAVDDTGTEGAVGSGSFRA